jgi:diguanylate cyclase (GGDEF)-like protein
MFSNGNSPLPRMLPANEGRTSDESLNPSTNDLQRHLGRLHKKKRPVVRLLVLATVAACLLLDGFSAWFIWSARKAQIRQTEIATSNVARMVETQVESAMKATSMALADVVERAEHDASSDAARERLGRHLGELIKTTPELHGLFVYGADGAWLATSLPKPVKGNNSDRAYFKYHAANPARGLYIGHPIKSRSTGAWVIPVSRRIDAPDGSFAGVALVTLRINFFERIYDELNIGKTGAVLLASSDGIVVYRRPFDEKVIGSDLSRGAIFTALRAQGAGSSILVAKVDMVERLYSYRRVDDFPFFIAVGLAKDEFLAHWRQSSMLIGMAALLINALFATFATKLARQIMIRDKLDEKLQDYSTQLHRHNVGLQVLAHTDKLTELANRRRFDELLEQEFRRAQRGHMPLSLILMDLDFFKQFNDRYGHPAGDACLHEAGKVLAALIVRAGDLAARYGGEEFAVLLPDTDQAGALAVAQRIRLAIEALQIPHLHSSTGVVTASLGVATMSETGKDLLAAGDLIEQADRQLYAAKQAGRNTVC